MKPSLRRAHTSTGVTHEATLPKTVLDAAVAELNRDRFVSRLPAEYRLQLARAALAQGFVAAEQIPTRPASRLAEQLGVAVERVESCPPVMIRLGVRSEYDPTGPHVRLYLPTLRNLAVLHDLPVAHVEEAALAHELFHHLESRLPIRRMLPGYELWRLGPLRRTVLPSRAREIAAHAFAMRVADLPILPTVLDADSITQT